MARVSGKHVIVIGAGLAGLAAAVELADAGHRVTILERAPVVGGRTSDWVESGMRVESGLHRYLGFYTVLPHQLKRVGRDLDDIVVWQDEIEIRTPRSEATGEAGPSTVFGASLLHRPIETLVTTLDSGDFLSAKDKLALVRMLGAGAGAYVAHPEELDRMTVSDLAAQHGVSGEATFRVLRPLTEGLFFIPPDQYSAFNFLGLILPYWKSAIAARIGAFAGGMTEVLAQPFADFVRTHGGEVRTGAEVEALHIEAGNLRGVRVGGEELTADAVVLATGIGPAQRLLEEDFAEAPWAEGLLRLQTTPSVSMQFELDEPALEVDRMSFGPGTILASYSEQSRSTFREQPGRLSVILASPETLQWVPAEDLAHRVVADAKRLGIELEGHVKRYRKVVFPMDFYSLRPGSEPLRPSQATPIAGLALAGDYTAQPYLTTMEGAVESGLRAARFLREGLE